MRTGLVLALLSALLAAALVYLYLQYSALAGSYTDLQNRYQALRSEYAQLSSRLSSLQTDYQRLQSQYNSSLAELGALQSRYASLEKNYTSLLAQYSILASASAANKTCLTAYEQLLSQYLALQKSYETLKAQLASLQQNYSRLLSLYNETQRHIAYFCAGATPAVFQAIHLAEEGALEGQITYEGQTACVGVQLTEGQYGYLLSLLNSSMRVGSGGVAVVEYLDPTCPYCALFYALYGGGLGSYVENGTVTLAVRYFPTHVVSYYQEGQYEAFKAGVEAWLYWQCAYGQGRLMEAVEGTYAAAARYIEDYLETGNSTDLSVYPLAELSYLSQSLPGCRVNATTAQLAQLVQSALGQISSEAQRIGVPQSMLGTPLFVVFRIK